MIPELSALYRPFIDAVIIIPFIIFLTRMVGLRSFSKMSGFDFAITVAMGSVLASVVIGKDTQFLTAIAALLALFGVQVIISRVRTSSENFENLVDNCPLLLMDGETIIEENLSAAKVTHGDLLGKLREANVLDFSQVRAVVFEATGDISVLHGTADGPALNNDLLEGVQRRR